jgi:hypothetical protein
MGTLLLSARLQPSGACCCAPAHTADTQSPERAPAAAACSAAAVALQLACPTPVADEPPPDCLRPYLDLQCDFICLICHVHCSTLVPHGVVVVLDDSRPQPAGVANICRRCDTATAASSAVVTHSTCWQSPTCYRRHCGRRHCSYASLLQQSSQSSLVSHRSTHPGTRMGHSCQPGWVQHCSTQRAS